MRKRTKYPTYILMTEDKEILWFGPSSPEAAQLSATNDAARLGKAVFFARVEGVASGVLAQLECILSEVEGKVS